MCDFEESDEGMQTKIFMYLPKTLKSKEIWSNLKIRKNVIFLKHSW